MKTFLAVFMGSPAATAKWEALDEATRHAREKAGMQGWMDWVKTHEKSIAQMGSPLGKTKLINRSGISNIKNALAAFTVVNAESHDAAAKLFENHPHFAIFPGESVELMECLPIPGM